MDAFFAALVPGHSESEIRSEFAARFSIVLTRSQIGNRKTTLGVKSGTTGGRFCKGHVPANKGRTWDEMGMPTETRQAMLQTCYKSGNLPKNARGVGEERVSKDGYIEVHISQRRAVKANDQWIIKHRLVWEEANGRPVPKSSIIVFADRNKRNFDPDNLVCVPRSVWSIICHEDIAYCNRETLELAIEIAKLKHVIHGKRCRERSCRKCGSNFKARYPHQKTCDACLGAQSGAKGNV